MEKSKLKLKKDIPYLWTEGEVLEPYTLSCVCLSPVHELPILRTEGEAYITFPVWEQVKDWPGSISMNGGTLTRYFAVGDDGEPHLLAHLWGVYLPGQSKPFERFYDFGPLPTFPSIGHL